MVFGRRALFPQSIIDVEHEVAKIWQLRRADPCTAEKYDIPFEQFVDERFREIRTEVMKSHGTLTSSSKLNTALRRMRRR